MEKKLIQSFKDIDELNPPSKLEGAIFESIQQEKAKRLKRKVRLTYFGLATSALTLIYSGLSFGTSFIKSDFWNMASLATSDFLIISKHWEEYSLSLLETFPVLSAIAMLVPLCVLLRFFSLSLDLNKKINNRNRVIT